MEDSQKQNTEMLPKKTKKISLEEYLDFFSSNKKICLIVDHLNQIIRMHGYMIKGRKMDKNLEKEIRKRCYSAEDVLTDAVSTIDLVDLSRSTLKESVSSSAPIPLEDVISDLKNLDWQECCVTSLITFRSWKQNDSDPSPDNHQEPIPALQKRGKKLRPVIECHGEIEAIDGVISSACASTKPKSKLGPQSKSKRKKTAA